MGYLRDIFLYGIQTVLYALFNLRRDNYGEGVGDRVGRAVRSRAFTHELGKLGEAVVHAVKAHVYRCNILFDAVKAFVGVGNAFFEAVKTVRNPLFNLCRDRFGKACIILGNLFDCFVGHFLGFRGYYFRNLRNVLFQSFEAGVNTLFDFARNRFGKVRIVLRSFCCGFGAELLFQSLQAVGYALFHFVGNRLRKPREIFLDVLFHGHVLAFFGLGVH